MTGGSCLVVMYHYVRDSAATPFPAIRALPPHHFEQQLDWLQARYRIIGVGDLEAAVAGDAALPLESALLTFDDGFVDHYETAFPTLRRRGIPGLFFVAQDTCGASPRVLGVHKTHFLLARLGAEAFGRAVLEACDSAVPQQAGAAARVFGADRWEHADERAIKNLLNYELPFDVADRVLDGLFARHVGSEMDFARRLYVDEAMMAEMAAAGMAFGYHTRSHRMLSRLPAAEQAVELRDGVAWIRGIAGHGSVSFCYPWGGPNTYTAETLRLLGDTGYSLAFNTVRRAVSLGHDSRFELPRIDTRDLPPYADGALGTAAAAAQGEA